MKIFKKILLVIGILILIGFIVIWDFSDREKFYSEHIPTEEMNEFYMYKTTDEQQKAFERNFGYGKYKFPRENVDKVKLFKNDFLISRLTSKTVSDINKLDLITFFNNSENFNWSETTWSLKESEYILRFYNKENDEIGKIWLCLEGCGMTESIPFSPNMKYGGLSKIGKQNINGILNEILTE